MSESEPFSESESESESESFSVNRRGLFLGAGVAALAASGIAAAQSAGAAPSVSGNQGVSVHPAGSPVTTTIASAPISGLTYRSVCMYDFEPFNPAAQKTWGGNGIYSAGTTTAMRATMEIPAGALVRDVEFYVYNNSGSAATATAWLYAPGLGTINAVVSASIPSTGSIVAVRAAVPSAAWGPYPFGSRLLVGMTTPVDGTIQINGAQVGYSQGVGNIGLLSTPKRVYDSRTGAKFTAGQVRTITLPAASIAPGTTGVLINVSALDGTGAGYVRVWAANATEPPTSDLSYSTSAIANAIVSAISSGRQLKIRCSRPVHVVVDLTGTIA